MRKVSLKKVAGVLCLLFVVIIGTSGCASSDYSSGQEIVSSQDTSSNEEVLPDQDGNPYSTHKIINGETIVEYDYSEAYEKLDLSEYTEHGKFGEDGIMWVKKSDYTGVKYGYMNFNGEYIIPLTEEIVEPGNYNCGFVAVVNDNSSIKKGCSFFDAKGKCLFSYYSWDFEGITHISDEIIIFSNIDFSSSGSAYDYKDFIYWVKTDTFTDVSDTYDDKNYFSISEDLLRIIYRNRSVSYRFEFYDMTGKLKLGIDEKSNENYKFVHYVDNFIDGKSTLWFVGQDKEFYSVTIDKNGNWLDEPKVADKNIGKSFYS